ncbi:GAF and ANTAR domain-containing protein [Actinophytocola sp.]|uniref:GAF and ANTAR domain-containing protein n=1 Tax=Actinophytocola sp. TaxID=1872138 RepID=UPI00389ABDAB
MDERRGDDLWRQLELEGPETDTVWDRLRTSCLMVRQHVHVDAVAATITCGGLGTTVATDRWAEELEDYQHTLGEGPVPEVVRSGLAVLAPDVRRKRSRWPVFTGRAAVHGLAAVFTVPLPDTRGNPLGTLTLYRRTTGQLSTAELRHTAVMAGFMAKLVDLDDSLREPVTTRISAAADLLATRHAMSREDALVLLRAHAYVRDRPLHEIADAVVDEDLWRHSLDDDGH